MGSVELKYSIHKIIDEIDNEDLLRSLYDFLRLRKDAREGALWKTLTREQKRELMLAFEESEHEENLIEGSSIFKGKK